MKTWVIFWIFIILYASAADEEYTDTGNITDSEAALKCDACKVVARKFAESFSIAQGDRMRTITIKDEEMIEAAESTCDDHWKGYGTIKMNNEDRLAGPASDFEVPHSDMEEDDSLWSRRLQDLCDEILGEVSDEKLLYNLWASDNSLEDYLCRGEGFFGACSSDYWGVWPGEDYDEYYDPDDFEYTHDEF